MRNRKPTVYRSRIVSIILVISCVLVPVTGSGGIYNKAVPEETDKAAKEFTPEEGKSIIYVYRKNSLIAYIQAFRIYLDKKVIINLTSGTFTRQVVHPGTYTVAVGNVQSGNRRDSKDIRTEAGKIYYIELEVGANIISGVPTLKLVEPHIAQKETRKCDLVTF